MSQATLNYWLRMIVTLLSSGCFATVVLPPLQVLHKSDLLCESVEDCYGYNVGIFACKERKCLYLKNTYTTCKGDEQCRTLDTTYCKDGFCTCEDGYGISKFEQDQCVQILRLADRWQFEAERFPEEIAATKAWGERDEYHMLVQYSAYAFVAAFCFLTGFAFELARECLAHDRRRETRIIQKTVFAQPPIIETKIAKGKKRRESPAGKGKEPSVGRPEPSTPSLTSSSSSVSEREPPPPGAPVSKKPAPPQTNRPLANGGVDAAALGQLLSSVILLGVPPTSQEVKASAYPSKHLQPPASEKESKSTVSSTSPESQSVKETTSSPTESKAQVAQPSAVKSSLSVKKKKGGKMKTSSHPKIPSQPKTPPKTPPLVKPRPTPKSASKQNTPTVVVSDTSGNKKDSK